MVYDTDGFAAFNTQPFFASIFFSTNNKTSPISPQDALQGIF